MKNTSEGKPLRKAEKTHTFHPQGVHLLGMKTDTGISQVVSKRLGSVSYNPNKRHL